MPESIGDILRQTIESPSDTTYLTHNFHPYAAKFIPQIPREMIRHFTRKGELVLDPFCGSGTSLVEAKLLSRPSIGMDINPMAVFMSRVKTTKVRRDRLNRIPRIVMLANERQVEYYANGESRSDHVLPDFPNRDHWFQDNMLHELAILRATIMEEARQTELRNLMLLAFSSIIVNCSNQDSETRYTAVEKRLRPHHSISLFKKRVADMARRIRKFNEKASNAEVRVFCQDSRKIDNIGEGSVRLIVTSPPYPNTYDYYLYHKMRMFWLGLDWENAKFNEIGSRLRHSSLNEGISSYMEDMARCFRQFHRLMGPGCFFVIVIGDSVINGEHFRGDALIDALAKRTGFSVEGSYDYDQGLSSKAFNKAFRQAGKAEHIILLKKPER